MSERISVVGSSKSEVLFNLIVLMHFLSMCFKFNFCFIHVGVAQMISQVTDRIYRGDVYEGMLKGETIFPFLLLEKSSMKRYPNLIKWIEDWASTLGREL